MVSKKATITPIHQNEEELVPKEKADIRRALNDIETPATFRKKVLNEIPTHRRKSSNLPAIDLENKQIID